MKIDLTKLKAGDTVKFRCGGEAVVNYIDQDGLVQFDNSYMVNFYEDGKASGSGLLDIIEIIPEPFNWDDVKPGMAFEHENFGGKIFIFVGINIADGLGIVTTDEDGLNIKSHVDKSFLTRTPEHDIEVKNEI